METPHLIRRIDGTVYLSTDELKRSLITYEPVSKGAKLLICELGNPGVVIRRAYAKDNLKPGQTIPGKRRNFVALPVGPEPVAPVLQALDSYNWREAFAYAKTDVETAMPLDGTSTGGFGSADVAEVFGMVEGENDGPSWVVYGRLRDGRFFSLRAGCDYTGWDCQASGSANVASSRLEIERFGLDQEERDRLGVKL